MMDPNGKVQGVRGPIINAMNFIQNHSQKIIIIIKMVYVVSIYIAIIGTQFFFT